MGMFDNIIVIDTNLLPVSDELREKCGEDIFQTKNFERMMDNYELRTDGLYHEIREYKDTPIEEKPYPDAKEGTMEYLCGIMSSEHVGWEKIIKTMEFNFYTTIDDKWIEFKGILYRGVIDEIVDVSMEARRQHADLNKFLEDL